MTEWKLVPVEPTEEMASAAFHGWLDDDAAKSTWKTMLGASPAYAITDEDVERAWVAFWANSPAPWQDPEEDGMLVALTAFMEGK